MARSRKKIRIKHIIITLIACGLAYTLISQQIMIYCREKEISKLNEEYNQLEYENSMLRDKIEFAKTEEYKERMAREKIGLIKPGDKVYIFD